MSGLLLALPFAACATGSGAPAPSFPSGPSEQTKCKVASGMASPLVTEWPASEKSNLEAMIGTGGVAVAFSGCSMRVLPQCRLGGGYHWQRTTPATDLIEIKDADELYAKLPLGAASLEGELKRAGQLSVSTTISGQLKLNGVSVNAIPADGDCASATHIVGALSVGAFALSAGAETSSRAAVGVTQIGEAGGSATRSKGLVRSAGDSGSCGQSTLESPHANCMSPIQVFLWPLPGRTAEEGPPGTVKVDFVAANANGRWDVYSNDEVICSTPCSKWVDPGRPILLRARSEAMWGSPDEVSVMSLSGGAGVGPGGQVQLQAHPTASGQKATGIVFTSFGGMAVIAGIALTAIGGARDGFGSGMNVAGLITMGVGLPVTAASIWLIVNASAKAEVRPLYALPPPPRERQMVFAPTLISGKF